MNYRFLVLVLVPLILAGWWILRDDPEAAIRSAHEELVRLIGKAEQDPELSILDIRSLQNLFAGSSVVTGDAETLQGTYSAEEMIRTIFSVQTLFHSIELTLTELEIEFPNADEAVIRFTADLTGRSTIEGEEEVSETRDVVSRMLELDGDWRFSAFHLTEIR
jgi:hypothetical protein